MYIDDQQNNGYSEGLHGEGSSPSGNLTSHICI